VAIRSIIVGTGSYIPTVVVPNDRFLEHEFHGADRQKIPKTNAEILRQFEAITGIKERRYVSDDLVTSDIAASAAQSALESSGGNAEDLDYIIVAHNFGDVRAGTTRADSVPSLAARVKNRLGINNPRTVAFDLLFGCPGWLQGMINADYLIRSGDHRRVMVIGAETLSRVSDPHDRDSLIYADGAGATILQGIATDQSIGILSHAARSDTIEHARMLTMGPSHHPNKLGDELYLKMEGRKLYKYALQTVAGAIKECLDKAGLHLRGVKKILIHQANEKMDEAILAALYELYGEKTIPRDIMPMTIAWLGNSSVATLPTMLDLINRRQLDGHILSSGDAVVFASVGAGMHINAFVYRVP
jgi:3-oxoacyl-[acyl-carrier-protein] synthase-3